LTGIYFKSFECAIASFISGIAIDIDHLIDYYSGHGFSLDFIEIYRTCLDMRLKKFYLILHSYEILILLWMAIIILDLSIVWRAVAIGLTQHVLLDNITNPIRGLSYFMTYRAAKRFDSALLLKRS
jgi:hypothetical protein